MPDQRHHNCEAEKEGRYREGGENHDQPGPEDHGTRIGQHRAYGKRRDWQRTVAKAQDIGMSIFGFGLIGFGALCVFYTIKTHFDQPEAQH
jgi:hypothetical protein